MPRLALLFVPAVLLSGPALAQKPLPPDVLAERLVEAGRKAVVANDPRAARSRFEEVVQKYGNTPGANAARFGLAILLSSDSTPDYPKAIELLQAPASDGNFADRAAAAHLAGVCQMRVARAEKDPRSRYERARQAFRTARDVARDKSDAEFVARASCDLADVELRLDLNAEARATAEPFTKDAGLRKSAAGKRGLYLHGLAQFRLKDYPAAGRSLGRAMPLSDPLLASHAEYLLGRIAQLGGEPAEAEVRYQAAIATYEKARADAEKRLKDDAPRDPLERAALTALVAQKPESVAAADYQSATLAAEAGQYADALPRFERFAKDYPDSPLTPDAHLRAGICYVQLGRPDDALKQLLPLVDFKRTADQALLWLGKAQLKRARAGKPDALKLALECLDRAVQKANGAGNEPDARARQHEARLELADARQFAGDARQAAELYEQLWNEQAFPTRREELLFRLADAWGRAGEFDRSRGRVEEFARTYPDSPLAPAASLRAAENALAAASRAESQRQNRDQVNRLYEEAAAKFQEVTDKSPDFARAADAHYGRAVCFTRAGQSGAALEALRAIPAPDRVGELAAANYLLGDCLLNATPTDAADEVAHASLTAAIEAFEAFLTADPKALGVPGALLKLGHARKRLAQSLPEGNPRAQRFDQAQQALERLLREFPKDESATLGRVELAKVRSARGDRGGAIGDLRPFTQGGELRDSSAAPLAALHLASLLREENRPAEAAKVLLDTRQRHEGRLLNDPRTAGTALLLKFHQAVALSETDKPAEAVGLLEQVQNAARTDPVAVEAALRAGQVRLERAKVKLDEARKDRDQANGDKKRKAEEALKQARNPVREAAELFARSGDDLRERFPTAEARARLYYESAWAYRLLAESVSVPPNTRDLEPARANYKKLIEQLPDAAVALDARLELADLLTLEGDKLGAMTLLNDALTEESVGDTAARVRLKLGSLLAQAGDHKAAAAQFDALAKDDKSPLIAQARVRGGEAHLLANNPASAVERLAPFLDDPAFRDRDNLSDRALLRLGQAHAKLKRHDLAQKAFEALLERFGQGSLAPDARFGLGDVLQAKGDHDGAIRAFEQVTDSTTREVAAQAQIRIGLSRIAQKNYADAAAGLLAVGYQFAEFPAANQLARLEAARALTLDGKPKLARDVLKKLVEELPEGTELGDAARARLAELK